MWQKNLQPSNLNNRFLGDHYSFSEYIQLMRNIIMEARSDLNNQEAFHIVDANAPFIWEPSHKTDKGVLMIHGLFDSPFFIKDIAQIFIAEGFTVYCILLPGHGTVPGDLLTIKAQEWIKAVSYGAERLSSKVKNLYLAGYSLGGALGLMQAFKKPIFKGLFLFAPALKPKRHYTFTINIYHFLGRFLPSIKWYQIRQQKSRVKYDSYCVNAAYQACKVMKQVRKYLKKGILNIPIFAAITEDDETICEKTALQFFLKQKNPDSRLIIYTNSTPSYKDSRIEIRKSAIPNDHILDFSHCCLTISPQNSYLGKNGEFKDFYHYEDERYKNAEMVYLGAISDKNLKPYIIQRLTYNPDFEYMKRELKKFLLNTIQT